jgi:hypothetical protein
MFGRKKEVKPLLTLDPAELVEMQRITALLIEAMNEASENLKKHNADMTQATRRMVEATAELKRAQKRNTIR